MGRGVVQEIARENNAKPGRSRSPGRLPGDDLLRSPGTKRRKYLEENIAAASLKLTAEDMSKLDTALKAVSCLGARYNERMMALVTAKLATPSVSGSQRNELTASGNGRRSRSTANTVGVDYFFEGFET